MMVASARAVVATQEIPDPGALESPLPGGVAAVVRFFLDFPQPLQIAGVLVAVVAAAGLAVVLWRRRAPIARWLGTRPRVVYAWAAGIAALLVVAGVGAGLWGWRYVQHDNGFCTGCHVMGPAFVRFTESEHSDLECHDCHQQPVSASMRQLYLWVLERPEEIGEHAPVATGVCARCHIQEDPTERWEAIVATQGHAVHLDSDASELARVQCVTCHGVEVHRFIPAEATCGQSGCHEPEDTRIVLGDMAGAETSLHCVVCHEFAAPLGDEVHAGLVPTIRQCEGCHAMEALIREFYAPSDPHEGVCGMCHDPHRQSTPATSFGSCAEAGCHEAPETLTAFHRGLPSGTGDDCARCHEAHAWVVEGDDCASCHPDLVG